MDPFLEDWLDVARPVGLAAAIAMPDGVAWARGFGLASHASEREFDPATTIINVGSVSKVVTGATIQLLVEDGRLALDEPVETSLTFRVRPPRHAVPITVRQLLTHTSAIADGPAYASSYVLGDPNAELGEWLRRFLDPAGDLYDAERNWHPWASGERWAYANVGFGLLGHIAELASGEDFRSLTRRSIFEPLGMTSTGWYLADIDAAALATAHAAAPLDHGSLAARFAAPEPRRGRWRALRPYGFPTYPDGLMRTTAWDLARFLAAVLVPTDQGGLLSASSRDHVFAPSAGRPAAGPEATQQGLAWRSAPSTAGRQLWAHAGNDPGVTALAVVDLRSSIGVALVSNSEVRWSFSLDELVGAAESTVSGGASRIGARASPTKEER